MNATAPLSEEQKLDQLGFTYDAHIRMNGDQSTHVVTIHRITKQDNHPHIVHKDSVEASGEGATRRAAFLRAFGSFMSARSAKDKAKPKA